MINDRYALIFDGATRYYSTELGLLQVDSGNCFGFLCMTFRTTSDDKGCFFIDDQSTDAERDKKETIITWVSRKKHKKNNLIAELSSKQLSEKLINDRYALLFDGATRYYSTELGLLQVDSGNCFVFVFIYEV